MRHKLQVELEFETKKKAQLEETVNSLQLQFRTSSEIFSQQDWPDMMSDIKTISKTLDYIL